MNKIQVPIKGLHCKSCEMMVEDSLKENCFIEKCEVSHEARGATIYYNQERPDLEKIKKAIKAAGYEIGEEEEKPLFSKSLKDYKELLLSFVGVAALFFILKYSGINNLSSTVSATPSSLSVIFFVGLTAGISTCMALVGGLVLGLATKYEEKHPELTRKESFYPHIIFNSGRIIGFGFLGGLLGLIGSAFTVSSEINGILIMVVAVWMFFLGLQLIGVFPRIKDLSISLPKNIARFFGGDKMEQKKYSNRNTFILGVLTFFLPCGFTQSIQVFALSSGSFWAGAGIMAFFALGTSFGLLGIGGVASVIKEKKSGLFFKFVGITVLLLAYVNFINGLDLLGYHIDWSDSKKDEKITAISDDPNVKLINGVQVVKMTEDGDGYSPNKFLIKKNIPVRWIIDAKNPYSCASALVLPKLKIRKFLEAGENIIEFTPTETGKLAFSCSMGMYTGVFNVN